MPELTKDQRARVVRYAEMQGDSVYAISEWLNERLEQHRANLIAWQFAYKPHPVHFILQLE
jgi:hypothetical protein